PPAVRPAKAGPHTFEALLGAALIVSFIIYTGPSLGVVRNTISPSVLGVEAVRQHLDRTSDLYVAFPMTPFIDYLLPTRMYHLVADERALPITAPAHPPFLLTEIDRTQPTGWVFTRDRGALWNIARRHYFEVALEPIRQQARFVSGWYPAERSGPDEWRWMINRSTTILPPQNGTTKLRIKFDVPDELMSNPPTIAFALNGALIDRFQAPEAHMEREWDVMPGSGENTLEITTDRTLANSSDRRNLGLLVRYLSWGPDPQ
ncbi:MAG TPA: hypothetical protein VJ853_13325, partial [Thermoanaerobaculia bacterium]|nr:hypothetical protein [Thermoanaerobaculia bacterium]